MLGKCVGRPQNIRNAIGLGFLTLMTVVMILVLGSDTFSAANTRSIFGDWNNEARTIGHLGQFALLFLCTAELAKELGCRHEHHLFLSGTVSLFLCAPVALLAEYLQSLTLTRTGSIRDAGLNVLGMVVMGYPLWLLAHFVCDWLRRLVKRVCNLWEIDYSMLQRCRSNFLHRFTRGVVIGAIAGICWSFCLDLKRGYVTFDQRWLVGTAIAVVVCAFLGFAGGIVSGILEGFIDFINAIRGQRVTPASPSPGSLRQLARIRMVQGAKLGLGLTVLVLGVLWCIRSKTITIGGWLLGVGEITATCTIAGALSGLIYGAIRASVTFLYQQFTCWLRS